MSSSVSSGSRKQTWRSGARLPLLLWTRKSGRVCASSVTSSRYDIPTFFVSNIHWHNYRSMLMTPNTPFLQAPDQHSTTRCLLWRGCMPSGKRPQRRNATRGSGQHSLLVWLKLMSIITVLGLQMHISLPWVCCDPLSPPHWLTFHCSAQSSIQNESLQKAVGSRTFSRSGRHCLWTCMCFSVIFTQFQTTDMIYSLSSGMKSSSNTHCCLFPLVCTRPNPTTRQSAWTSTTQIAKAMTTTTKQVIPVGHGLTNGTVTLAYKKSFPRIWEWSVGGVYGSSISCSNSSILTLSCRFMADIIQPGTHLHATTLL